MTSNTDEWATPKEVFEILNEEFDFTLDPCASDMNYKCEKYYTKEEDGLSKNWGGSGCFAILHTPRLGNGLRKHTTKGAKIIRWLCC